MKCSNCGADLSDNSKFCSFCGAKIGSEISDSTASDENAITNNESPETPVLNSYQSSLPQKKSIGESIKAKLRSFWGGMDLFCKVSTIAITAIVILLVVSVCTGRALPIIISALQFAGVIVSLLIHKDRVVIDEKKSWIKYLVLIIAIVFTVLNVMSYSWGRDSKHVNTPVYNQTESQPSNVTDTPVANITTALSPCGATDCVGKAYTSVKSDFNSAGFVHIKVESIEDLQSTEADKVDTVESVSVGGSAEFSSGQEFDKNAEVVIRYHTFKKCEVTIHVDFIPNLIFSTYDVNLLVNSKKQGSLTHGDDKDFTLCIIPGEYTLTFENAESSSVKGEVSLTVDCDIEASYKISCYSDKVSVETLYVDRLVELSEGNVKLDVASSEYKHKNYEDVTTALNTLGFTNIKYVMLYDIVLGWTNDGEVDSVSIDGNKDFKRGDVFAADVEIVITYHMPKDDDPTNITMPKDSDGYDGMNYLDVEQAFKELGFTNIAFEKHTTESAYYTDGEVYSVEINNWSFDKEETFKPDDKVTIKYYVVVESKVEESGPVFYSTNDYETAKKGNTGVFSYKDSFSSYDVYWIIDFDEGYVYYFTDGNGDSSCDRLKIESGDLNDKIIITYHDGNDEWSYGLHFKYVNHPETLIMQDNDGFEYKYSTTSLNNALSLRDSKTIKDY